MTGSSDESATVSSLTVLTGSPSPTELAAIVAVIEAQMHEAEADALHPAPVHPSAWDRSRAALRTPLAPGAGAWRSFG